MLSEFGLEELILPAKEFGHFATAIERWADSTPIRFKNAIIKTIEVYDKETGQIDLCTFIYKSSHRYAITDIEYDIYEEGIDTREFEEDVRSEIDRYDTSDNGRQSAQNEFSVGDNWQGQVGSAKGAGMDRELLQDDQHSPNGRDDGRGDNGDTLSEGSVASIAFSISDEEFGGEYAAEEHNLRVLQDEIERESSALNVRVELYESFFATQQVVDRERVEFSNRNS